MFKINKDIKVYFYNNILIFGFNYWFKEKKEEKKLLGIKKIIKQKLKVQDKNYILNTNNKVWNIVIFNYYIKK